MSNTSRCRRIAAHYVYSSRGLIPSGLICVDPQGVILSVEQVDNPDKLAGTEFYDGILIPGMVNAHCHLELSGLEGMIPSGTGFRGFAAAMREVRGRKGPEELARAAHFQDARMFAEGISVVADVCNSPLCDDIKRNSAIKYYNFCEVFGLHTDQISIATQHRDKLRDSGMDAVVTPHSFYSVSDRRLRECVAADPSGPFSIHFMESDDELALFSDSGPMKQWYDEQKLDYSFIEHYCDAAGRLVANIPSDSRIILVHNTLIDHSILQAISERYGDKVTFVLCPGSNDYISCRQPDFKLFANAGSNVAIGTDSLASNRSLSMIEEMKKITGVPLRKVLDWATINGARALGCSDVYGSIEPGKSPGIVQLYGVDLGTMCLTSNSGTRRLL